MSFPRPSSPLPDITAPAGPALAATTATTTTSPEWHRLSTPFALRLLGGTAVATVAGFALGVSRGGTMAGLRFRAENAHRQPRTMPGWYLYHKSKNYHVIYGGVTQGLRMAGRCGVWVGMFSVAEEAVDHLRRRKDCLSTVVAGLGTAGIFSLWNRFPLHTAVRTARTSLYFGLGYGLAQDMLGLVRGHRIGYVDWIGHRARRLFSAANDDVSNRGTNDSGQQG